MAPVGLKGKEKAVNEEEDLNPITTYRHLLTNRMGVLDPFRVVALCDLDAFYAAAERVRLNLDPEVPLAVQQWKALIAVNYPARKFGITRMETAAEALKKCPNLVLVHTATYKEGETEAAYHNDPNPDTHKVSLDHYRRESMKILKMHQSCMEPGVEVEKASIDEAFFDFTVPVKAAIMSRYPYVTQVPDNAPQGLDTPLPDPPSLDWDLLGNLVPIDPSESSTNDVGAPTDMEAEPPAKELSGESTAEDPAPEAITQQDHTEARPKEITTWHDVALSIAAEFMMQMRMEVKGQLGYTTSAGIARNKMLAKLVASYKKFNQQTILRNAAIPNYLRPMAFQKIRFLGGKLGEALADEFGAKTVGDVLSVSLDEMQVKFGEESIWVYNILRGIDHSEVKEKVATKSMLASKNIRPNATKLSEVTHWLRVMASELSVRLLEARERSASLWPKTLVLHVRQSYNDTKSRQAPFPYSNVITPEVIIKPAEKLFKELLGTAPFKISNIQLSFSGLAALETGQKGIEGFFAQQTSKDAQADAAAGQSSTSTDDIKRKRAPPVGDEGSSELSSLLPPPSMHRRRTTTPGPSSSSSSAGSTSFQCGRCKKTLSLSKANMALDADGRAAALERLKVEHGDFHVAEDLAREVIDVSSSPEQQPPPKKKAKGSGVQGGRQQGAEGIAKYFSAGPRKK